METYKFLLDLGIILLTTKLLGLVTRKFNMPQVVGALLAGLLLGPGVLNLITQTEYINYTAEVGVVVLMFCAGMETDVKELKKSGKSSLFIAILGVIFPLIGGFLVSALFSKPDVIDSDASASIFLQNLFIGIILTATSVSITVETLKELGKLKTHSGNAILGAAVIDDILGIIALTIVTSMADSTVNVWIVLLKIVGFFIFSGIAGFLFYQFFTKWSNHSPVGLQRHAIIAFAVLLTIVAILTKIIGCGLGAKICKYKNYQSLRIGVGMISRGEVALIVANKGAALGLMGTQFMGPVVIVVILTTIIAPILLKPVFRFGPAPVPTEDNVFAKNYEGVRQYRSSANIHTTK